MRNLTGFLKRTLILIFSFFILFGSFPSGLLAQDTQASGSLTSSADAIYTFKDGNLIISLNITIASDSEYPSIINNYNIFLPFKNIKSATISNGGNLLFNKSYQHNDSTEYIINFGNTTIRESTPYKFNALFEIENFTAITEDTDTYKFSLPINIAENLNMKSVQFIYETSLGSPIFSSLPYTKFEKIADYFYITFNDVSSKNDGSNALSIIIGEKFSYDFSINKTFENFDERENYIATVNIPRQQHNQLLTFRTISPNPDNIYVDSAENLFFQYNIKPKGSIVINISGNILIDEQVSTEKQNISDLTTQSTYWLLEDESEIKKIDDYLANKAINKDIASLDLYEALYNYLSESLSLKNDENETIVQDRIGADVALNKKENLSPEDIIDVYMGVYRHYGIPCRMIMGFVLPHEYGKEGFYHYWLEVWSNEQKWIILDPVLDIMTEDSNLFNKSFDYHIAIIAREKDPINPIFSFADEESYEIKLAENSNPKIDFISISTKSEKINFWNKKATSNITIKNSGNTIIKSISTNDDKLELENLNTYILPLQEVTIKAYFNTDSLSDDKIESELIITSLNDENSYYPVFFELDENDFSDFNIIVKIFSISLFVLLLTLILNIKKCYNLLRKRKYE